MATNRNGTKASYPFRCVHCGTPCHALYRRFDKQRVRDEKGISNSNINDSGDGNDARNSAHNQLRSQSSPPPTTTTTRARATQRTSDKNPSVAANIKLSTCTQCGKAVDPYIEREWILKCMDCVLRRKEAFRHVLFNEEWIQSLTNMELFQFGMLWSILDCYVAYQSGTFQNDGGGWSEQWYDRSASATASISMDTQHGTSAFMPVLIAMMSWWASSFGSLLLQTAAISWRCNARHQHHHRLAFLAFLLPSSFTIVTSILLIWENSNMVRGLSSLLMAYWQTIAIGIVVEDHLRCELDGVDDTTQTRLRHVRWERLDWMWPGTIKIIWRLIVANAVVAIFNKSLPCSGFATSMPLKYINGPSQDKLVVDLCF
uniref:Protein ARV n=1 Tax=Craspedostauros australis TaxID=1486917 RepID=A0A7R9ZKY5_9STRA